MSTMPHLPNRTTRERRPSILATGLFIATTLIGAGAGNGQSFDCRRARSADEMTICQESGLAKLDQELASLKHQRKEKRQKAERDPVDDNETAFLNARRRCRENHACIEKSYRNRIQELSQSLSEEGREPPSRASASAKRSERSERRNGSTEAPETVAAPPSADREVQAIGTPAAPAERQPSADVAPHTGTTASEPPKQHAKRNAPATAQRAPTATPTIQWVDPPPSR